MSDTQILDADDLRRALTRIAHEIVGIQDTRLGHGGECKPVACPYSASPSTTAG